MKTKFFSARRGFSWAGCAARRATLVFFLGCTALVAFSQTGPPVIIAPPGENPAAPDNAIVLPGPIADPIEPVNRRIWAFNRGALTGVIKPSGKVYRTIVVKPLRIGISNIGRNIAYPKRLVNNLLQARWEGAGDETSRFLCNTVLGIGGLFDMATRWDIPASEADFGQTFGRWGWRPDVYLMLPILGPSNDRDAVGAVGDAAVNPLTYFSPWSYIQYGITYNNLAESVDEYVRQAKTEADPYYVLHYASSFLREERDVDFEVKGDRDPASLETIGAIFFTFKDRKFPERGATRTVRLHRTGKELPYRVWLQPRRAPIVYIVPGIGAHRLNGGAVALAELLFNNGFSVATLSSAFNYEFMENASTTDLPGYAPVDAHDVHLAVTRMDEDLKREHPERLGARALMGYSMGGFHTAYIASGAETNSERLLQFDRYVSIDTPVRLTQGIETLDRYFSSVLQWPSDIRSREIENTFRKVAALAKTKLDTSKPPPFSGIESQFLVGLAFRLNLRDVIFFSQARHNQGVLKEPIDPWHREPVYREILQYSYGDYLDKFLTPYYKNQGIDLRDEALLKRASDLTAHTTALRGNSKLRLIENRNDILLTPKDLAWLDQNFGSDRITFFEHGGHLGNLSQPEVQQAILHAVEDLKP